MLVNPDIARLIDEIRGDRSRGATELARQALLVLKKVAQQSRARDVESFLAEQRQVGQELAAARPAMASIGNAVGRLVEAVSARAAGLAVESLRRLTISRAEEMLEESRRAVASIAQRASELLADGDRLLAHSYSSTVLGVLGELVSLGWKLKVTVTRSGPGRTGEEVARQVASLGLPVTFIDDAAVALCLADVDKVLLGADAVCPAGVVNGIGSLQVAVLCAHANVPVYVLADSLKLSPHLKTGMIDLEDRRPAELAGEDRLPPGMTIRNPHFDITPLELISAVVSEDAARTPEELVKHLGTLPSFDHEHGRG